MLSPKHSQVVAGNTETWFWAGWEPDRFYRRQGANATLFYGNGDWIKPWRQHLESVECLKAVRDAGGTMLMTRFYKGFGMATERKDWDSLREYVERAHSQGLRVLGYLQGRSLFGETLFHNEPDARNWVARAYDGTPERWGGAYYRFAPCMTSEGYRKMMLSIVREGLLTVGLDGYHIDNNYYTHCYCERCRKGFRDWLRERGDLEELTGIGHPDCVEPPPLFPETMVADPLKILWIEYGVRQRYAFYQAIRDEMRSIRKDLILSGNPAFMRSYGSRLSHALDLTLEGGLFDMVCVENGNRPRYQNGLLYTQADKHLLSEAAGLKTWVTSWEPNADAPGYKVPDTPERVWGGLAEEFSYANAFLGNNWALRPAGDGGRLMFEQEEAAWATFRKGVAFFGALGKRFDRSGSVPWSEVVVYVDTRALSLSPAQDALVQHAFLVHLLLCNLPFKIVFQAQPIPAEARKVVICCLRSLAAEEVERLIADAREHGRQLYLFGECGTHDEWLVPRSKGVLRNLFCGAEVVRYPLPAHQCLEPVANSSRFFRGLVPQFNSQWKMRLEAACAQIASRLRWQVTAPAGVLANAEVLRDETVLVHLRDLRDGGAKQVDDVILTWRGEPVKAEGFSPLWPEEGRVLSGSDGLFPIPPFQNYACIKISRLKSKNNEKQALKIKV